MSFLDKLGETLKGIGWAIGAPVGTAIDVAKAALPGGDPALQGSIKAITTGVEHGTQLFTGGQNGEHANLVSDVTKPAMDALDWVYREGISRPLNFMNIETQRGLADLTGTEDGASPMDVGSAWDRASNTHGGYSGQGTSIGREWGYTLEGLKGLESGILDKLGVPDKNAPNMALSDRMSALTDEGQKALDQGKSIAGKAFDVESGGIDAVARWYLDPTIVGGKAVKAARLGKVVSGLAKSTDLPEKLAQQTDGLFAGFGKRHDAAIQFAMAPNRSAGELVAAFPGLRESMDGESVASVLEQTNKSMRAAGKSDAEIYDQAKLITRASMGDLEALQGIDQNVAFAKDALAAMQSNRDELQRAADWAVDFGDHVTPEMIAEKAKNLDLAGNLELRGRDYLASDEFLNLTSQRLQSVQKDVAAAEQEAARQVRVQNLFGSPESPNRAFGSGSDQPLLASALGARTGGLEKRAAKEAGTYVGVGRRLGEKALAPVGLDFVFQSTAFNKAVKVAAAVTVPHIYLGVKAHQAFGRMAAPSQINVEDEHAGTALNAWLKHTAVSDDDRMQMVSDLMRHQDTNRRGQVIEDAIRKGVESKISAFKAKNPYFTDETEQIIKNAINEQARQDRTRMATQTMAFTAAKRAEDTEMGAAGSRGDLVIGDDGMPRISPLLPTQLTKIYGMPNLKGVDQILHRHGNWITDMAAWAKGDRAPDPTRIQTIGERVFGVAGKAAPKLSHALANTDVDDTGALRLNSVNDFAWKSEEVAKMVLDSFNKLWKTATLATRPVAYAMRVNVDSGMRFAASTGMSSWVMHSAPRWAGFATLGAPSRIRAAYLSAQDDRRLTILKSAMETAEDAHKAETGTVLMKGVDPDYDALATEASQIEDRLHQYTNGGRAGRRSAYGAASEPGMKSIQTRAGEIEGAYHGEQGLKNRWLSSSQMTAALLGDGQKLALKDAQIGNWTYVQNTDPNHMESWKRAINQQLLQTDVGREAVKAMVELRDPQKASAQLARWATTTPEGKKLMGEMVWHAADKRAYTNELIGYVNHYLPSHDLRAQALKNGRIEQGELERALPNIEDRPPVHGESLANAINRGNPLGKMINNSASRILKWAGEATEDQLARHPMYAAVYEQEAKRRAEFLMADPRIESIGLDQVKRLIQDQAHAKARQALKNYMFDIAATSDLSHFMRFTSPFVAAWEDTIRKWGRIAKENPDLIGKAMNAWNAPNAMGMVVDQNGNPVDRDGIFGYKDPKTGEHVNTYVLVPRGLTKWIPGAGDSQLKINKQSLNIVLQGGLQPGFGPLVAYPVGRLQEAAPQLDGVAKFVNPYGPPASFWDAVAPTTVKAFQDAVDDQSRNHEADTRRVWAQMLAEYRLDPQKFGGKQPTIDEAAKRAGSLGYLKILNRVVGVPFPGFPATFQSPYQLYIDSYHALQDRQRTEGHPQGWADDQFIQQFGDTFFPLVQSQSQNNGGLLASAEAVDASSKYKALIAKYGVENGQPNSTLTRLIVGAEGEGAYNDSAHQWQEQHQISPASGVMYRSYENPQAAQADADAKLGWLKWRQKTSELDARAIQEGLKTFRDDPDLVTEYNQFKQSLAQENNAWYVDWSQQDNTKFTRDLQSLGEIANSGKFGPMRTDMVGVKDYLALRQAFEDEMTQYGISPTSQDAQPFRQEFTDAVADLVSSNSQFAEWSYYTFLDRDPYLEPVTSQGNSTQQQQTAPTDWGIG